MKRAAIVGLAAALGGALAAAGVAPAAAAAVLPLEADFGVLLPGASAEAETSIVVPSDATVMDAAWAATSGDGMWDARLCTDLGSCTPVAQLAGDELAAGTYRIVMGVTMPMDAGATGCTTAEGRISLMESIELPLTDGGLAVTGGAAPWGAALLGAAVAGTGAALLLGRRRTEEKDEEGRA